MKKWVVFQLKISKMIKEWSDRSWTDAQAFNPDDHAWKEAAQEMITAQSELFKEMLDDFQMPEEVKSKSMPIVDEYTGMLEKYLSVLATGSNLMNRSDHQNHLCEIRSGI
ncbi:MAG: hypothetical protein ACOC23_08330 [Thermodesulfobacteriota bacterium]